MLFGYVEGKCGWHALQQGPLWTLQRSFGAVVACAACVLCLSLQIYLRACSGFVFQPLLAPGRGYGPGSIAAAYLHIPHTFCSCQCCVTEPGC